MSVQISKFKPSIISSALLLVFGIAYFLVGFNNILQSLQFALGPYYSLIKIISNEWFFINGENLLITGDSIMVNETKHIPFGIIIMFKKVFLTGLILIILTRSKIWIKLIFGLILFLIHALIVTAHNIYIVNTKVQAIQTDIMGFFPGIAFFIVGIILTGWYFINKQRWEAPIKLFEKKSPDIIILLLVYTTVIFALVFLDFKLWIQVLLGISKYILQAWGYSVTLTSNVLAGDYGSVSLTKPCLGLLNMYVFAALIYISASNKSKALLYIMAGVLVLNFLNIFRIILLFAHLQKHGDYMLTMDIHDICNYVIYSLIFLFWVIWFEFCNRRIAKD